MVLIPTASQTVGPFLHIGMNELNTNEIVGDGERIAITGRILDGEGQPVPDAVLEFWQANAHGKYAHPEDQQNKPLETGFTGFARIPTDTGGGFRLSTVKPGPVPARTGGVQAPHILIGVMARGLLARLVTRIYFSDEAANAADPVLALVAAERRATLIARREDGKDRRYVWDIRLRGEGETVFFEC
ncbi:MAG: protocatechuate 3,4-dioxygenase subunit alpha [Rhodospirillales bacterium]|nr:protocatechuate 3,4-dioxygenase subunit alpha [Rhodospirillales bacterium]